MPQDRPATEFGRAYMKNVALPVKCDPCHVVLDVMEGGCNYVLRCFSARDERFRLKAEYGFFSGRS